MASINKCHALLVKSRGIPCRCVAKFYNEKDNNYYCGRHFKKIKDRAFKNLNDSLTTDCAICLSPILQGASTTACGHRLHIMCILDYKSAGITKCPVCEQCILYDGQEDNVARDLKKHKESYAGFQVWCIQKAMSKRLITSTQRNTTYCLLANRSVTLHKEMKQMAKWSQDRLFDKLMELCRDYPNILQ